MGTLRFWDSLPHRSSSSSTLGEVQGVIATDGLVCHSSLPSDYLLMEKIIAWCDVHVVIWKYQTGKHGRIWIVQSTLQASDPITTLDFKEGKLPHNILSQLIARNSGSGNYHRSTALESWSG